MVALRGRGERSLENKWGLAPFILGQKQRVLEPYSLSLFSMVTSSIPKDLFIHGKKMLPYYSRFFGKMRLNFVT